jgi:aminoglycoside phosphotransferase (APT) family kinase protein
VRPEDDRVAALVGRSLGGAAVDVHRLPGGASRTTSAFDLESDGGRRPLILQVDRGAATGLAASVQVEAALLRAAAAVGVPVPAVVGSGTLDDGRGWLVVERVEGETIPRRILREESLEDARQALAAQCGAALAAIHRIDPATVEGLPPSDALHQPLELLDGVGAVRPVLELGVRWLSRTPVASSARVTVHGDFRLGNLLVGTEGLRAVLDWELAHAGDPAEDLGWLCARAWRFGAPKHVGGFGDVETLLDAYEGAGGERISAERLSFWEAAAAVRWAVICALQASTHLRGVVRSVELAAIGRRVCESEWDLLLGLGVAAPIRTPPSTSWPEAPSRAPFGDPSAAALVEAVRGYLEQRMLDERDHRQRFDARVARNALAIVGRELAGGDAIAAAHAARLSSLGFTDDAALAAALRCGRLDGSLGAVGAVLAESTRDQLLVANPSYLLDATAP